MMDSIDTPTIGAGALGPACGADALQSLDGAVLQRFEPALRGVAALFSLDTGIIDSHASIAVAYEMYRKPGRAVGAAHPG